MQQPLDDPPQREEFHEPSSPYYGLSLQDQLALSKWRRGSRKTAKVITKTWKKATIHDHSTLMMHCINALVQQSEADVDVRLDRIRVRLKLLFNYRSHFGKSHGVWFPRPVILAAGDFWILVEMSVDVLLDYLHAIGRSAFTARELRKQLWSLKAEQDRWFFLQDYSIPLCETEWANEIVVQAKSKSSKGRRSYRKTGKHSTKKPPESPEQTLDTPTDS